MEISQKISLNQVEIVPDSATQVRLVKTVIADGSVLFSEYHRTTIPIEDSAEVQLDIVNNHLADMGWPPLDVDSMARIVAFHNLNRQLAGIKE